jgi:hypothetical protein
MVKFCPECGKPLINETSKFCDKCGANTDGTTGTVKPERKTITVEFILGLIGGIIGFFAGGAAVAIGGVGVALASQGASQTIGQGFGAIIFSIVGIAGVAILKSKTKIAGYLMIISAFGGLICISVFFILSFVMLLIAGIMAVRYKD